MANLTPEAMRLMEFWGSIQSAVTQHGSTQELWQAIRTQSELTGRAIPAGAFLAANQLRSLAVGIRTASEALADLTPSEAITGQVIGQAPYGRSLETQALAPAWEVRFLNHLMVEGEEEAVWNTTYFYGNLPATVEELNREVLGEAQTLASHYESLGTMGISNLQVNAF